MTYTITYNEQYKSHELTFDGKPSEAVRELLKANGYRWHSLRRIWYGYKDIADKLDSTDGQTPTAPTTSHEPTDKEQQAALLARYMDEYRRIFGTDEKFENYLRGNIARFVELNNGELLEIEKPKIQTRFCFGYGFCGRSTNEDEERASDMATYAETNENYFLERNLEPLTHTVDKITAWQEQRRLDGWPAREPFICDTYDDSDKLKKITFMHPYDYDDMREERKKHFRRPTAEELNAIKKAFETETKAFEKRLRTYLKRYGLSKLNVWTYLVD